MVDRLGNKVNRAPLQLILRRRRHLVRQPRASVMPRTQLRQILYLYVPTIPNLSFIANIVPCLRRWLLLLLLRAVTLPVKPLVLRLR
jgi:hypothetical protein